MLMGSNEYIDLVNEIKQRIQSAQYRAALEVNTELVMLYHNIGSEINKHKVWGNKFIDSLSADLRMDFPGVKGYSVRNLKYMSKFAELFSEEEIVQEALAQITWYHHVTLMDKVKDHVQYIWYAKSTARNGWSRNVLVHQIESGLYERQVIADMTLFSMYEDKLIRLTDDQGNTFTGIADTFPAEYGMHEFGTEEEGIQLGEYVIFRSQIAKVEILPTYEEAVATIPIGRYRHFKGNEYEVIVVARHSETEEAMVVYKALYGDGGIWCRPASMWNETVERDGKTFRRFYRLDRIERVEKYERLFDEATDCPDEEKLRRLHEYYTSGQWREDYEADENGELPPDLKRGVLSQDALYNLLTEAEIR